MSTFSDQMGTVAVDLITEFGEVCTFTRETLFEYNPGTAESSVSATVTFTSFCVPEEFTLNELDDTTIERGDIKLLVGPIVGNEPKVSDQVTLSSRSYRVIDIKKSIINAATVLYELQVRE